MKTRHSLFSLALLLWALLSPATVQAEDAKLFALVQDLQKQMMQMQYTIEQQNARIADLEKKEPAVQIPANVSSSGLSGEEAKWLKGLSFKGDLRLRYEAFDFHSGSPTGSADRTRFRYRLRYGFEKKFNEEMKVGFAMASGESAGTGVDSGLNVDQTSTNQTFDNLFNFKEIWIEKAFAQYSPGWAKRGPIEKVTIAGGKFDNPFEKGSFDSVWDRDVKPEGIYEKFDLGLMEREDLKVKSFLTLGQFVLDEDTATGEADAELFGQQLGVTAAAATPFSEKPVEILSAVSFYNYSDYAINGNFLIGATSLARGNTNVSGPATVLDSEDFEVWEYYNEVAFDAHGIPVRPFFDLAHNVASQLTEDEDVAWALGTKVGAIKKKGDWEIGYSYRRIEPESVVGAFSDSDFGLGHAGKRGSALKLGYALTDYLTLNGAAYWVNNLTTATAGVRDEEQRRFQFDLNWKF